MAWLTVWDRVNEKIAKTLANYLTKNNETSYSIVLYGIQVFLNSIEKMFLLLLLFILLGEAKQFFLATFFVGLLRIWMGGSHRQTFIGCTLQTAGILLMVIKMAEYMTFSMYESGYVFVTILSVIWLFCPEVSQKRGDYHKKKRIIFKIIASMIVISSNVISYLIIGKIDSIFLASELVEIADVILHHLLQFGEGNN